MQKKKEYSSIAIDTAEKIKKSEGKYIFFLVWVDAQFSAEE